MNRISKVNGMTAPAVGQVGVCVFGGVIQQFGPARSNIFYSPQHRLISADNGGPVLKLGACRHN
jgi:hypothetical protein